MEHSIWSKVHGATVRFPIALVLCSFAVDRVGPPFSSPGRRRATGLYAAGYWTLLLGAAGTVPAVVSGLVMTRGVMLGHGALRLHHLFAWPAFALVVAAAVWRVLGGSPKAGGVPPGYLCAVGLAAILVMGAGYWGGEMLLAHWGR